MQIELNANLIVWNYLSLQIHIYVILIEKILIDLEQTKKKHLVKRYLEFYFFFFINLIFEIGNTSKIDYGIVFIDIIYLGIK